MKAESGRAALVLGPSSAGKTMDEAVDVQGRFELANFLSAEGLQPDLGRSFSPQEERSGRSRCSSSEFRLLEAALCCRSNHLGQDPGSERTSIRP